MDRTKMAYNGMVTTPHHLATQSAVNILRNGGTAMEAVIAAAATISVVLPDQTTLGGDAFWLIVPPHDKPFVIQACGPAGANANLEFYKGYEKIPYKGPKAAITVAGLVSGWQVAVDYVTECGYQKCSASSLLADAIKYAEDGFPVSDVFEKSIKQYIKNEKTNEDFNKIFCPNGKIPKVGEKLTQKTLAQFLRKLVDTGFDSFYKGELAKTLAEDMKTVGMPITFSDLANFKAVKREPLLLKNQYGNIYTTPPPSQGLIFLSLLGILDKLNKSTKTDGQLIHTNVEGLKQACLFRDKHITDPRYMQTCYTTLLNDDNITKMADAINPNQALQSIKTKGEADTVYIGVMDSKGFSISYMQSVCHEFGSGVVLPSCGILWHNRGVAFTLDQDKLLSLKPGKLPLHTLIPAAAVLNDGRVMVFGSQGGDGQPQFTASNFHRYVIEKMELQKAISAPRYHYGRIVGDHDDLLRLEEKFDEETVKYLKARGHKIKVVSNYNFNMGISGALVRHPNRLLEGAFDPRGDGSAVGF